jgi:hypothetical protein
MKSEMHTHRTIVIAFSTLDGVMQDPDGSDRTADGRSATGRRPWRETRSVWVPS